MTTPAPQGLDALRTDAANLLTSVNKLITDQVIVLDLQGFLQAVRDFLQSIPVLLDAESEGECWRCGLHVTSRTETIWLDSTLRNDCPESEDGAPHEVEEPE